MSTVKVCRSLLRRLGFLAGAVFCLAVGFLGLYGQYLFFVAPLPEPKYISPTLPLLNAREVHTNWMDIPNGEVNISIQAFKEKMSSTGASFYAALYGIDLRGDVNIKYFFLGQDGVTYYNLWQLDRQFHPPFTAAEVKIENHVLVVFPKHDKQIFFFGILAVILIFFALVLGRFAFIDTKPKNETSKSNIVSDGGKL